MSGFHSPAMVYLFMKRGKKMSRITEIQKAIDYIENHLCENIDYDEIAKCACTSSFHFQRIFNALCGITIGDYIRQRRLTLAGSELISTDKKIIDIAFDYGYDTPESFSRAFSKFHSVTPSEARKSGKVKSFSRISVKLVLTGGDTMDYRIEKRNAIKVLCKRKKVTKPVNDSAIEDIRTFWADCGKDGSIEKLCSLIPKDTPLGGLLGISFSSEFTDGQTGNQFPYGIGFAMGKEEITCPGFDVVEIPSYTYAVFKVKGKMPEAFQNTYKKICGEFFAQSDYEYAHGAEFEVYPSPDVGNPDYECEMEAV